MMGFDVSVTPDSAFSGDGVLVSSGAVVAISVASSDAGRSPTVSSPKGRTPQSSDDASGVARCSDVVRAGRKTFWLKRKTSLSHVP